MIRIVRSERGACPVVAVHIETVISSVRRDLPVFQRFLRCRHVAAVTAVLAPVAHARTGARRTSGFAQGSSRRSGPGARHAAEVGEPARDSAARACHQTSPPRGDLRCRDATLPTIVTSRPSSIHAVPSTTTTMRCHSDRGGGSNACGAARICAAGRCPRSTHGKRRGARQNEEQPRRITASLFSEGRADISH